VQRKKNNKKRKKRMAQQASTSVKPLWKRAINKAVNDTEKPAATWFQLATIDQSTLQPRNRTVVFRGWLSELAEEGKHGTDICFTADSRHKKASEAGACEVCWYLSGTRDQFRLQGRLEFHNKEVEPGGASESSGLALARYKAWNSMGKGTAAGHLGPPPGDPKDHYYDESEARKQLSEHPPETLLLGVVHVDFVDHLHLGQPPFRRTFHHDTLQSEWVEREVNP